MSPVQTIQSLKHQLGEPHERSRRCYRSLYSVVPFCLTDGLPCIQLSHQFAHCFTGLTETYFRNAVNCPFFNVVFIMCPILTLIYTIIRDMKAPCAHIKWGCIGKTSPTRSPACPVRISGSHCTCSGGEVQWLGQHRRHGTWTCLKWPFLPPTSRVVELSEAGVVWMHTWIDVWSFLTKPFMQVQGFFMPTVIRQKQLIDETLWSKF